MTDAGAQAFEQPAPVITHAIVRAKERYGIDLDMRDLHGLVDRCAKNEGRTGTNPDGSQYHALVVRDQVLWVVYRGPEGFQRHGRIITVLPHTVGEAKSKQDDRQKFKRINGWAKKGRRR